jgi:hypothetical protein
MSTPAKKPLSVDDVEQAIREILRVAALWAANRRDGVSPSAMAYHEKFLRTLTEAALGHWNKLPLKTDPKSKNVLRSQDFRSYSVLLHVMGALERYQRQSRVSGRAPNERNLTELIQFIQAGLVVLGRDKFLRDNTVQPNGRIDGIADIKGVLDGFVKEKNKEKKLERNLRRTAGTIVRVFGGTSGTKLFKVRDVVEQEGPEDLKGSPAQPLITRRRLEEQVNGRHVPFQEIRAFALRLLGISAVSSPQDEEERAPADDTLDRPGPDETFALVGEDDEHAAADDFPSNVRAMVEEMRRHDQALARHLAKYPSSISFRLIGDDDIAPLAYQPPKRVRAQPGSQKKRED